MKQSTRYLWPIIAILAGSVAAWMTKPSSSVHSATSLPIESSEKISGANRDAPAATEPEESTERIEGQVAESINVPNYTYLRIVPTEVKESRVAGDVWAAVAAARVSVGQQVTVVGAQRMNDFNSKTLSRTFPTIYFGALAGESDPASAALPTKHSKLAGGIEVRHPDLATAGLPPGHPPIGAGHPSDAPSPSDVLSENGTEMGAHPAPAAGSSQVLAGKIERASGSSGRTVSEVVQQRGKLVGKQVRVRGVVVKSMAGVLGKTFAHIRDGSGDSASSDNDLTVTAQEELNVGATVTFEGTVIVNKDFGAGYSYPVLLEDARVVDK